MKLSFRSRHLPQITRVVALLASCLLASCATLPPLSSLESWHRYLNQYVEDNLPCYNNGFIEQAKPFVEKDAPSYLEIQYTPGSDQTTASLYRIAIHDMQWQLYTNVVTDKTLYPSFINPYHNEQVLRLHFSSKDAQAALDLREKVSRMYVEILKSVDKHWSERPTSSQHHKHIIQSQKIWAGWGDTVLQAHWAANIQRWRHMKIDDHTKQRKFKQPLGFKEAIADCVAIMQKLAHTQPSEQPVKSVEAEVIRFPDMMKRPSRIPLEQSMDGVVIIDFPMLKEDQLKAQVDVLRHSLVHSITPESVPRLIAEMKRHVAHIQSHFRRAQRLFVREVRNLDSQRTVIYFSGYRGFFFPTRPWTSAQKTTLLLQLAEQHLPTYDVWFFNPQAQKKSPMKRLIQRLKQEKLASSTLATIRTCSNLSSNMGLDVDGTTSARLWLYHQAELKHCTVQTALPIHEQITLQRSLKSK